jgi:anti-anti-sigma regulatory factor
VPRRYLAGQLDAGSAPFLAEYLGEQTATRPAELVLDLREVTLVAAAGLAHQVEAASRCTGAVGARETW